jgi:hypothetical protein
MPKVVGTLRHRYPECRVVLKVFNRPRPNIGLYGYSMSTTSKVIYSVRGFLGVPNEKGNVITPTGSILLPPTIEELRWFFELLVVIAHFSKVDRKSISASLPLLTRIFEMSHRSMWMVSTIASVWGSKARFAFWAEKVMGM